MPNDQARAIMKTEYRFNNCVIVRWVQRPITHLFIHSDIGLRNKNRQK